LEKADSIFHNSPNHSLKLDIATALHHAYQQGKQDGQREMNERAASVATEQANADLGLKLMAREERDGHGAMIHAAEESAARCIAAAIRSLDEVQDDA
jgi:hypothetical protein